MSHKYDIDFILQCVALIDNGVPTHKVAIDNGIRPATMYRWHDKYGHTVRRPVANGQIKVKRSTNRKSIVCEYGASCFECHAPDCIADQHNICSVNPID